MDNELLIRHASLNDINTIGYLAHETWPDAFKDILTPEQIRYMLHLFYDPSSLHDQIVKQKHRFLIAELGEEPVGFASYSALGEGKFKLHKIYLLPITQGKGVGKALIQFIIDEIRPQNAVSLKLNVNRHNKARIFYEKLGFAVVGEEDNNIGNNYFMNDFVMEKKL